MSGTISITMTPAGAQTTPPATINANLFAQATILSPGITVDLPGSMIDDIGGTATAGIALIDAAMVDLINSVTPLGANLFVLEQQGQLVGCAPGGATNTSVYLVFTSNTPGYTVLPGFTVTDGTYQYVVQDGGAIGTGGTTAALYALATITGSWAVPANTVTDFVSSAPGGGVTLSVNNPTNGTPGAASQAPEDYRAQVFASYSPTVQGAQDFLKAKLLAVPGVQANLVSVRLLTSGGWEVIVGGGDPYQVAGAIYLGASDISVLHGSTLTVSGITNANPGVVTTELYHNYTTGQVVQINGATGITGINGVNLTVTVLSPTTFSIGLNTTSSGTYTGNGVLTPNLRNTSVSVTSPPDTYPIPFVIPPQMTLEIVLSWNTTATNLISSTAFSNLAIPAIASYVNALSVGQPINIFAMNAAVQNAVSSLVSAQQLSELGWSISINGVGVTPETGTGLVAGDPESYFFITASQISVSRV